MDVVLKPGGKLSKKPWDPEKKKYSAVDITDDAMLYLMCPCSLDKKVVLRDVFLLIEKHLDVLKTVLNYWVEEFTEEALKEPAAKKDAEIEYLELYWWLESNPKYDLAPIAHYPRFHGIGRLNKEKFGIEFHSLDEIANLPLKLNDSVTVCTEVGGKVSVTEHKKATYTLLDILYGIVWEISFYGPPGQRDKTWKEINEYHA